MKAVTQWLLIGMSGMLLCTLMFVNWNRTQTPGISSTISHTYLLQKIADFMNKAPRLHTIWNRFSTKEKVAFVTTVVGMVLAVWGYKKLYPYYRLMKDFKLGNPKYLAQAMSQYYHDLEELYSQIRQSLRENKTIKSKTGKWAARIEQITNPEDLKKLGLLQDISMLFENAFIVTFSVDYQILFYIAGVELKNKEVIEKLFIVNNNTLKALTSIESIRSIVAGGNFSEIRYVIEPFVLSLQEKTQQSITTTESKQKGKKPKRKKQKRKPQKHLQYIKKLQKNARSVVKKLTHLMKTQTYKLSLWKMTIEQIPNKDISKTVENFPGNTQQSYQTKCAGMLPILHKAYHVQFHYKDPKAKEWKRVFAIICIICGSEEGKSVEQLMIQDKNFLKEILQGSPLETLTTGEKWYVW